MMSSSLDTNIILSKLSPIYEIIISFVLGAVASIVMKLMFKWFKKSSNRLCIIIACILITYWSTSQLHGSPLLACMSLVGMLVNIFKDIDSIVEVVVCLFV